MQTIKMSTGIRGLVQVLLLRTRNVANSTKCKYCIFTVRVPYAYISPVAAWWQWLCLLQSTSPSPTSPRAFSGSNMPRRAISTTVPHGTAGASEKPTNKFQTMPRLIQVPHTFVSYSVTRPAVCQFCNRLLTPFRPAKQCKGLPLRHTINYRCLNRHWNIYR